jgi:hypothetical protein
MPSKYTVVYRRGDDLFKICKVFFGADGSYYVTCPYHPYETVVVFIAAVRYADEESTVDLREVAEVGVLDDDDRRLKLAHHVDGFLQFSGEGVVSGIDEDGNIKGIGIKSWPLFSPTAGPSFGLAINGIEKFARAERSSGESTIVFDSGDVDILGSPATTLLVEGTTSRRCGAVSCVGPPMDSDSCLLTRLARCST